jgi:hypothetical protein
MSLTFDPIQKFSLYASCHWDEKAIRRLIGDGKLAARLKGLDDAADLTYRECPICFFNYSEINVTKCCHALICTECYLQVKPQKPNCKNKQGKIQHHCPFCNASRLNVGVAAPEKDEAVTGSLPEQTRSPDQQKIQHDHDSSDGRVTPPPPTEQSPPKPTSSPHSSGFGSHLEKNARVAMMRARSSSMSESQSSTLQSPVQEISNLAMTPEERRALESEVRAQHNHPLAIRLEQEEAERRMRNEYEYYQQRSANSNRRTIADVRRQGGAAVPLGQQPPLPPRGARELSRLMEAVEHQRNNNVVDFAVLEAALMMSMQEEARRRGEPSSQTGNDFSLDASARVPGRLAAAFHQATVLEEEQLAMAIAASLRESNNDSNHDTNENDNQENNGNDGDDGSDV